VTACPELSALEGEATASIRNHLAACSSCRLVVELLDERRRGVKARDLRDECAKFEMLLAARDEGTIGGTAGALLEAHLGECADCQAVAATMPPPSERREHSSLPPVSTSAYALGREVARGGMGRILEALDVRIGRPVAVKELLGKAPALAARFEREARVTARLQHPGIVPIYEIGKWPDGTPFYSMRMVEGRTLRDAIRGKKSLDERLALLPAVIAAAEAVAFAHGKKIIHRDLTPNNILVGEYGDTVVIDWGLAKDLSAESGSDEEVAAGPYRDQPMITGNLTNVGAVIGTAAYMPPEQANGAAVDERADVYSLGAILYHVLAGTSPYHASKSDEVVRQVQAGPPEPIDKIAAGAPRDLVSIVTKAMSRVVEARYPTAHELADELRRFQTGRLVEAHHYSRRELVRRWGRRWRGVVTVTIVALIVVASGGAFAIHNVLGERDRAEVGENEAIMARAVAEEQRKASHALTVTLTAEQGRQELLAGHPTRALPFLSAAYSDGDASPETRFMIAAAMHEVDGLEHVLNGASESAQKVEFSRDGTRLLVVRDDVIEVWDVNRGILVQNLRAVPHFAGASFSPDGDRVVAWAAATPRLFVFDVATGTSRLLLGHTKNIIRAMFTRDGLVSVGWDSTWRRWDLATGESRAYATRVPPQFGHDGPAGYSGQYFDRATTRFLTLAVDGTVEVWDIVSGVRIGQLRSATAYGAAMSPDGKRVLTWNLERVTAWNVETGQRIATASGPGFHITRCGFRGDGAEVFVAGDSGKIDIWTATLDARTASFVQPAGIILPIWAGPHRILAQNMFGGLRALDPALETEVAAYEDTGESYTVNDDGSRLAIAQPGGLVQVSNLENTRLRRRFSSPGIVGNKVSPDGSRVAAFEASGAVTLRDVDHDGAALSHVPIRQPMDLAGTRTAAVTPDGNVVVLDSGTGTLIRQLPRPATAPTYVELSPDGHEVLVVEKEASHLWDIQTGVLVTSIPLASSMAHVSADGGRVIVLGKPRELVVWDVAAAKAIATIALPGEPLFSLFFLSRDGRRVAVPCGIEAAGMLVVYLYDTTTARELTTIPRSIIPSFATNDDRMIAAGYDGVLHVIRPSDGIELAKLPTEPNFAMAQITADGTRFAVTKGDGIAEIRSLADGRTLFRFPMRPPIPQLDVEKRDFNYRFTLADGVPDSVYVTGNETGSAIAGWDIHLETRPPGDIAKLVAEHVPWRLEGGRLVPASDIGKR
jgi:WD40 repeat protein